MSEFMFQLLNGLTLGGIYALIALGYTMVYGIIKLINFAHGDIFMVGAFAGLLVASFFTQNFFAVLIISMAICALLGIIVEKTAYRPLRDSSSANKIFTASIVFIILSAAYLSKHKTDLTMIFTEKFLWAGLALFAIIVIMVLKSKGKQTQGGGSRINALISAIGMSIIISNMTAIVYGPQRANYPKIIDFGDLQVGGVAIPLLNFFIIGASLILMLTLYHIVHRTKAGLAMRAVSQNMEAARLMGISPDKVIGQTFALGSALAAAAGVLVGVHYGIAEATMGSMYGLKAFVAAVLGGIGNIPGAMIGGFVLGVAEIFGVAVTPYIVKLAALVGIEFSTPSFKDAISFGILIFILIIKPTGIMGRNIKEKV